MASWAKQTVQWGEEQAARWVVETQPEQVGLSAKPVLAGLIEMAVQVELVEAPEELVVQAAEVVEVEESVAAGATADMGNPVAKPAKWGPALGRQPSGAVG